MNLINVIPISNAISKESLDYYSTDSFDPGNLVQINLRNRQIPALVVESTSATENKMKLRTADFELKKIQKQQATHLFAKSFIETCKEFAEKHAISTGAVIASMTPKTITAEPGPVGSETAIKINKNSKSNTDIIQKPFSRRLEQYQKITSKHYDNSKSSVIVCPTINIVKTIYEKLVTIKILITFTAAGLKKQLKKVGRNDPNYADRRRANYARLHAAIYVATNHQLRRRYY